MWLVKKGALHAVSSNVSLQLSILFSFALWGKTTSAGKKKVKLLEITI